jgi:biotin carboxylase
MLGALDDFQIAGVITDLGYLREVLSSETFLAAEVDTMFLESFQRKNRKIWRNWKRVRPGSRAFRS